MNPVHRLLFIPAICASLLLASCASMIPGSALSNVKFSLDHVSSVRVAGIDMMNIDSLDELNMFQMARATLAMSKETLPLDMTVHLKSENPIANQVAARLKHAKLAA